MASSLLLLHLHPPHFSSPIATRRDSGFPTPLIPSPFRVSLRTTRRSGRGRCSTSTSSEVSLSEEFQRDEQSDELRIMLSGGGTGGHIYPAIAVADEIKTLHPTARFRFVGRQYGVEWAAVQAAGFEIVAIQAYALKRPFLSVANLLLPFRLLKSMAESWRILDEFRPEVVIGTGGYVSFPVCFVAALRGIKMVIQEQNSQAGLANWVLSAFATKIFLAFSLCVQYFPADKCMVTGNPVRPSLRAFVSKAVARTHFFPSAGKSAKTPQVVLILGGSAKANNVNVAVLNMYSQMLMEHKDRYIIWQTGHDGFDEMESLVKGHRRLSLVPFLERMDLAYAAADLVISRAGAMTCTEILTTGKPSILIPLPDVAEDHQTRNASIMTEIAGSMVLDEEMLDSSTLRAAIEEILGDESLMTEMSEKCLRSAMPEASRQIAEQILSLVDVSHKQ
ncbi:uncharacterized protein LOC116247144 isoform X1 [Nymphaea colorata]|nr:uncharacterized protein LOC116247144 isoform X1 [Nymphaea colorata]XP_031474993.1 uncharacterized protein LOC116247144 isoform X1 [Nymphaea colorata]